MVACHKYDDSIVMILLVVIINSAFMSYVFVCNIGPKRQLTLKTVEVPK